MELKDYYLKRVRGIHGVGTVVAIADNEVTVTVEYDNYYVGHNGMATSFNFILGGGIGGE